MGQANPGEWESQVIGQLINEDAIPLHDGGFHGTGRDIVPISNSRAKREQKNKEDQQRLHFPIEKSCESVLWDWTHTGEIAVAAKLFNPVALHFCNPGQASEGDEFASGVSHRCGHRTLSLT